MDDNDILPLPPDQVPPPPQPGIISEIEQTTQNVENAAENAVVARVGTIQMVAVESTDIIEWGYDPVGFKLQIHFRKNNRIYVYEGVSPVEFQELTLAPSKGSAFWAMIRRNPVGHPFTRIQ